jgi:hypothetical protein
VELRKRLGEQTFAAFTEMLITGPPAPTAGWPTSGI